LIFPFLEVLEFYLVVGFNPAGFVKMYGFPAALGIVFVLEAILDYFELQLSHGSDNLAVVELIDEKLGYALVHELLETFGELFGFHGVVVLDIFKKFGRETG